MGSLLQLILLAAFLGETIGTPLKNLAQLPARGLTRARLARRLPHFMRQAGVEPRRRVTLRCPGSAATEEDLNESWKTFTGAKGSEKQQWYEKLEELRNYQKENGDCALGFRDQDDPALVEWVKEQRMANLRGKLDRVQKAELDTIGFRWKSDYFDDQAEWTEMFNELKEYLDSHGTLEISPISTSVNARLMHWTHVQRELAGGGILPVKRRKALEGLGFEFDGPVGSNH
uniref:Helicase-associated domain-containing protein n=1 Tax=Lotharella globosa TaxID=91324 RepID=A0A7S3Z999_9EUKA|mmetsp:Transcript_4490/g.8024  ORF Transcript_4490/g.8024 Transcript_4490/m.8024 type:complete len:230 (-) Transcript_4490:83-772(-)